MEEPSLSVSSGGESDFASKNQVGCVKDEKKVQSSPVEPKGDPTVNVKKEEVTNGAVVSNGEVTMDVSDGKEDGVVEKDVDEERPGQETEESSEQVAKADEAGTTDAAAAATTDNDKGNDSGAASGSDKKSEDSPPKKPAIPVDERPMEMERTGGAKRALRIKLRGLPLDKYVRDLKSLYKLVVELFVKHLQVRVPNVKSPIWGDKWLGLEMKNLADKQKVLSELDNYVWQEYTLTAQDYNITSTIKFDMSPPYTLADEDPVVTQENVLSFFLKYRNLPYKYQLEMKTKRTQDAVSELLEHLRESDTRISNYINQYPPIIEETVPSMLIDGYTIDNYFHIGRDKETNEIKIGMKIFSHGNSVIAPISECVNIPRYMAQLAQAFIAALPEMEQLKLYDEETEEGDLLGIGIQMNFIGQLLLTVHVVRELAANEMVGDARDKNNGNNKKGRGSGGPKNFNKNKPGTEQNQNSQQPEKESADAKEDGPTETKSDEAQNDTKGGEDDAKESGEEVKSKVEETEGGEGEGGGSETKTPEKEVESTESDNKNTDSEKSAEQEETDVKMDQDKAEEKKDTEEEKSKEEEATPMTTTTTTTTGEEADEQKAEDKSADEGKTDEESKEKADAMEVEPTPPPVQRKEHLSDKDLKQILMEFYKKYGSDLGVESIYYRICYYQNKKEVGNKFNENVRVVGPGCLHEMLGGVSFMVNPERMWAPPNRSFEAILSVVERLGRIGPDTVVILVSTDQRYVPLYLSKKCKEVIALGCWNFQTSYNAKRIADSKGCRNTEYCNVTGKLPISVWNRIQSKQRVVAIFWDNADTNVLNKLLNLGCCNFIDVVSSEKRFSKSLYRHIVHADLRIVPTVVVPVDSHPHTDRYALVVKFSSPNMSPQLMNKRKKKNQGYHHHHHQPQLHFKRSRGGGGGGGGGGPPPRHHASTSSLPPFWV